MAYDYYRNTVPGWGTSQFQFGAPPAPMFHPQPSWSGLDFFNAHAINPDPMLYKSVMARAPHFAAMGLGRDEARYWHKRIYSGLTPLTQVLPSDIGAAAAYEAYRTWKHNSFLYEPLSADRQQQREGLIGMAIGEATRLWHYAGRPTDTYGLRAACEAAAAAASILADRWLTYVSGAGGIGGLGAPAVPSYAYASSGSSVGGVGGAYPFRRRRSSFGGMGMGSPYLGGKGPGEISPPGSPILGPSGIPPGASPVLGAAALPPRYVSPIPGGALGIGVGAGMGGMPGAGIGGMPGAGIGGMPGAAMGAVPGGMGAIPGGMGATGATGGMPGVRVRAASGGMGAMGAMPMSMGGSMPMGGMSQPGAGMSMPGAGMNRNLNMGALGAGGLPIPPGQPNMNVQTIPPGSTIIIDHHHRRRRRSRSRSRERERRPRVGRHRSHSIDVIHATAPGIGAMGGGMGAYRMGGGLPTGGYGTGQGVGAYGGAMGMGMGMGMGGPGGIGGTYNPAMYGGMRLPRGDSQ